MQALELGNPKNQTLVCYDVLDVSVCHQTSPTLMDAKLIVRIRAAIKSGGWSASALPERGHVTWL